MTTSLRKLLITGGNGQLALALRHHPLARSFQLIACSHAELDITGLSSVQRAIKNHSPAIALNTAAYTAVDKAESEPELATKINHHGAKNLAVACREANLPLIHLSTDYVFDGRHHSQAYLEEDETNPINIYGLSKWRGEEAIREH